MESLAPATVTEAVRLLEARGYRDDFRLDEVAEACPECAHAHRPSDLVVRYTFRFEGSTDPADEAIVLGVESPSCGVRGIVVSAFGPDADEGLLELVDLLARGRGGDDRGDDLGKETG
jgi:hypothetical protein